MSSPEFDHQSKAWISSTASVPACHLSMTLHGGCQCRKVRYTIDCDIAKVQKNFCHCRMCQLATGSPVAAFFTIPEVRVCVLVVSIALGQ